MEQMNQNKNQSNQSNQSNNQGQQSQQGRDPQRAVDPDASRKQGKDFEKQGMGGKSQSTGQDKSAKSSSSDINEDEVDEETSVNKGKEQNDQSRRSA